MTQLTHSERAMAAALAELKETTPQTAAFMLFFAAARQFHTVYGSMEAAKLAYYLADKWATEEHQ